ncbi:hypothetical protein [Alterisphingorhabdus coralli]|uniref:Uncharacterized protein n=1 Tax=Alterisphingorhabdus coralli TaxID=3071408 RepID=A0AA97F6B4_9SPHN|nr:hypothetical protein [Parasphingorhabdus sp. SCSIO 66989]WOE74093.1 hypothetical protein RB602_09510 [Parasphingorhabdus sp. SCSIO 66989]
MDRPRVDPEKNSDPDPMVSDEVVNANWVHDLIAMTRPGAEINLSYRALSDRVVPFAFDDFS